jgi:polygalacturonase
MWAQGKNITIEGVVLRDSAGWTLPVAKADGVQIRNLKIFGWRGNSDGIDICNSRNVEVSDCFLRTFDDLVVIKTNDKNGGPTSNIVVKHCVLWNEFAHALSLGAELRTPVENVSFSDCDVIHDKGTLTASRLEILLRPCPSGRLRLRICWALTPSTRSTVCCLITSRSAAARSRRKM